MSKAQNTTAEAKTGPDQETIAGATKAKTYIQFGENGVATLTEKNAIAHLLPEDVTMASLKRHQEVVTDLAHQFGLGFGEASIEHLKANPELKSTSLVVPLTGRDKLTFGVERTYQTRNPSNGETTDNYGGLGVKYSFYGSKPKGEMGKIKDHLATLAAKSLASKK